ncbi:aminotransferase class V-fold PLP-dependent enzyme [Catalinimonas niigatensis]|uniref:aminotransferase class V-fold PLP-dependent enzyme n=1 Tax=Catalinimonas niigatensis TaxID=1397264 RepID=UPI002665DBDD|nr:aminotransferase class V-fold PLP-dependent enzyme [Catalinimonas niigatensis]WPP48093.1 aminotransferase class V-fold PLP-dependent enzyme [Catalinimonas niigatensis]
MIFRRRVLKMLSGLPLGSLMIGGMTSAVNAKEGKSAKLVSLSENAHYKQGKSIYMPLGVRPLINARGTVTIVGATRMLPEVQQAMDKAVREYVQLDELMEGVGQRLATLTGTEWGIVTSGASAALTVATAGCVSGGNPDKLWQIPNLVGMKDEVIIPSYSRTAYDAAAKAVGMRMVEVSNVEELKAALGPRTALVMVLAGSRSENGPLSLKEIASLARPQGVPILVDAAAEGLEVPNPHIAQGADLVVYSGGKYLRGPQCAGLLLGRKDLVQASWIASAPHHGFGRGFKVGREEIMGMLTAAEMWMKRDHDKEWRTWTSWANHIANRLEKISGVETEILIPQGRSNRAPTLQVQWDMEKISLSGYEVEQLLWDGAPRIAVSGMGSFLPFPPNTQPTISINPSQLEAGEEKIIAERVFEVLSQPPAVEKRDVPAAYDISGQWDLEMKFAASTEQQSLLLEQEGNKLRGIHRASFGPRDLQGTLQGSNVLLRSSYKGQGVRLNFEFTGKVNGDRMEGKVSLSEYGMAAWKAKRRTH